MEVVATGGEGLGVICTSNANVFMNVCEEDRTAINQTQSESLKHPKDTHAQTQGASAGNQTHAHRWCTIPSRWGSSVSRRLRRLSMREGLRSLCVQQRSV